LIIFTAYESNPPAKVDAKQWREDWDDEDINDEFTQQLKRELNLA
jgi:26 proteasome complex subunit DSS1